MIRRKLKLQPTDEVDPIAVPSTTGDTFLQFPGGVIDNLRHLIMRISKEEPFPSRLALVAALRGEGVTYLSRALAATLANDRAATICVVDLNWWWPSEPMAADRDNGGLAEVLSGRVALEEVITSTGWSNLAFVPAGKVARQERPILANSPALRLTIEELSERFDHLILDTPAILATTDAVALAGLGTGCCQVICQGVTHIEDVHSALDEINHLKIYGVLLNQARLSSPTPLVKALSFF